MLYSEWKVFNFLSSIIHWKDTGTHWTCSVSGFKQRQLGHSVSRLLWRTLLLFFYRNLIFWPFEWRVSCYPPVLITDVVIDWCTNTRTHIDTRFIMERHFITCSLLKPWLFLLHLYIPYFISLTRLEFTPWGALPPLNRTPAEGGVPHVWDLSCWLSNNPQRLPGRLGATGLLRGHAW